MGQQLTAQTKQSACAVLEAHPMGSLGGMWTAIAGIYRGVSVDKINPLQAVWPISFLGATYFAAALAAWIVIGWRARRIPALVPWLARLGALASVLYIVVIIVSNKLCPYCIASHIGNLTLWLALEIGMMKARSASFGGWKWDRTWSAVVAGVAVFAMSSGTLAFFEISRRETMIAGDAEAAARTLREIQEAANTAKLAADQDAKKPKTPWGPPAGFRGRWLLGPAESPVRVVMLTDFLCKDCREFEAVLMAEQAKNPTQISVSIVHFPMCSECNPQVGGTLHPEACKAALAVEAVAAVAGANASLDGKDGPAAANEAFWKMATWAYAIEGEINEKALRGQVAVMGISNPDAVIRAWQGQPALKNVQGDCIWGEALGLFYTPMMFVNGVEVRGWASQRGQALSQAINAAMAAKLPATDARNDAPALVGTKYFEDWKLSPRVQIPPGNPKYIKSAPGAKVDVVVWGDLTEPGTKELDAMVQTFVGKKAFNYVFRYYPACSACNPGVDNKYPAGCIAAQAVEAAGNLGGVEAYTKMKAMILERQSGLTETKLSLFAGVAGLEGAKFDAELVSGPVKVAVSNDVMAGKPYVTHFVPTLFIDGKYVERWKRDGDNVLERILDYAIQNPGK